MPSDFFIAKIINLFGQKLTSICYNSDRAFCYAKNEVLNEKKDGCSLCGDNYFDGSLVNGLYCP